MCVWHKCYLTYEHEKVIFKKCWCLSLLKEGSIAPVCNASYAYSYALLTFFFWSMIVVAFSFHCHHYFLCNNSMYMFIVSHYLSDCNVDVLSYLYVVMAILFKGCFLSFMLFCQCSLSYWYFIEQLWWVLLILASLTRILCREVSRFLFNSAAWSGSFKLW